MKGNIKGYLFGAKAAFSYGLNPTFALPLYEDGMNPDSVLMLRYGFAILMVALMILVRGGSFRVPKESVLPLAGLGIVMAVFFHEKLRLRTALCIILAFSGIMMLYYTGNGGTLSLVGTLIVIASAVSYAVYLVAINHRRVSGIETLTVTFYVLLFGSMLFSGRLLCGSSRE